MSTLKKILYLSLFNLVLVLCSGCGGSTTGTGGITVSGKVLSEDSMPLPGVTVTLLETGDQTISDSEGSFALVSSVSGDLNLEFESLNIMAAVKISNVPSDAESVNATFRIRENGNRVDADSVEIRRRKKSSDPIASKDDDRENDSSDSGKGKDDGSSKDDKDKDKNKGKGDGSDQGSSDQGGDSSGSGSSGSGSGDDHGDSSGSSGHGDSSGNSGHGGGDDEPGDD